MSAHNVKADNYYSPEQTDPAASGTIYVNQSETAIGLVSVGVETRTLARPTRAGIRCLLWMKTNGGNITLTVTGGYNTDGDTTFTFSSPGQFINFVSVYESLANVYEWRKISDYSTANLTPTEVAFLDGVTAGTALASKALVLDASGNLAMPAAPAGIDMRNAEVVITTNVILAAENGRTYYLDLAGGFVSTLPAAALGLSFEFVVKTAPTGSYTIVCPAAATLFKGHILSNDLNSATDSDFGIAGEATVTFVLNKAVAGDRVQVECDGVNWHVRGECSVFDAITIS